MSKGGQAFRKPGDWFHPQFRYLIRAMMKQEGRDLRWCEVGKHRITGRTELHHTKYEGATYQDLSVCCSPCNHKKENVLLT